MSFKPVPPSVDFIEQEYQTLDFWKQTDAFKKLVALRKDSPRWAFTDGPITATTSERLTSVLTPLSTCRSLKRLCRSTTCIIMSALLLWLISSRS